MIEPQYVHTDTGREIQQGSVVHAADVYGVAVRRGGVGIW